MTAGDKAEKMLLVDEGLRLKPYRCTAGKLTIGYGRNLDDVGISREVAYMMLQEDLQIAEKACKRIFPELFDQWGENRRLGWINLAFNLGYNRLMQFRNTLRAARIEDWPEVEKGLRASLWFKQVGKRAERVIAMVCHETFPYN
jgi:lysozyme